jgi:hypothetical protein
MTPSLRGSGGRSSSRNGEALKLFGVAGIEHGHTAPLARDTGLIPFREMAAVVSPSRYARVQLTPEEVAEYARVVAEVHDSNAILPAPPGTVVRSSDSVARWLELHYFTLSDALRVVEGNTVARVKILAPNTAEVDDQRKQNYATAAEVLRVLRGQAAATVSIPSADGDDPRVVGNMSFLVERERWTVFTDRVTSERQRHPTFELELTGPWPPYDFVRMQFGV